MDSKHAILLVQDEPTPPPALAEALLQDGHEVTVAGDADTAFSMFVGKLPDLVIVALGIGSEALPLCAMMRGMSTVPIMVVAKPEASVSRIAAYEAGAEICIRWPTPIGDIVAQVRAVLRRNHLPLPGEQVLHAGDIEVDLKTRTVLVRCKTVRLTPKEFDLLVYMMRHRGEVLTYRALLGALWGSNYVRHKHYLHVLVRHLRTKIETDPSQPLYIVTEPWIGYRFDPPEAQPPARSEILENDLRDF
ncbi:MAG TPA: response regulator transcription factor [Terriglobales bacterium]|nr:response regulator transcription factor [Terriglobales bacterium]